MFQKKRVLIAVGGTGGHVFPAISVAKQLRESGFEPLFVGGDLSKNKYFDQGEHPYREITCGFLSTKNPLRLMRGVYRLARGIVESRKIFKQFNPDIVIGFGSYYTMPTLVAAKLQSLPILIHEQNAIPGRVNRLLSKYASCTAITIPDASKYLSGVTVDVTMPLREGYEKGVQSKEKSRTYFQIDSNARCLLVFGGSQGANAINESVKKALVQLKSFQVIHITGDPVATQKAVEWYRENGIKACVKDFETRMDLAWSAADFAVTRSGAGTVAEAIAFEVPSILVPFPRAMDNHQEKNADFMVNTVGGAVKILEKGLSPDALVEAIESLDIDRMRDQISEYKQSRQVQEMTEVVEKWLES